jgi:hypothetical protein
MTRTNAFSILCVAIRTFALWLFADTLIGVPTTVAKWEQVLHDTQLWIAVGENSGIPVLLAVLFWIFADKLARLALARPQQMVFDSDMPAEDWQTIAFSVVGLWYAIVGLAYLSRRIFTIVNLHFAAGQNGVNAGVPSTFYEWLVADCMRFFLGVALLFGARGLVGLIRRYRQFGHDARERDSAGADVHAGSSQEHEA